QNDTDMRAHSSAGNQTSRGRWRGALRPQLQTQSHSETCVLGCMPAGSATTQDQIAADTDQPSNSEATWNHFVCSDPVFIVILVFISILGVGKSRKCQQRKSES